MSHSRRSRAQRSGFAARQDKANHLVPDGSSFEKAAGGLAGMAEVGRTGIQSNGGVISEEFLPQLRGAQGRKVLREMADNDPIIGGFITAFIEVISRLDWRIDDPEEAEGTDSEAAVFLQEALEDMSEDFQATLGNILTCLTYGWSFLEIVYKKRTGPNDKPSMNSKFSDGRIGWRKWAPRSQHSLVNWIMDEEGGVQGMHQVTTEGAFDIPIEKALLFRVRSVNGNPEGRPVIRNCYRPWFFKKRIEEIEAIGIERDLAGMPVVRLPLSYFDQNASPQIKATLAAMENLVRNLKRNEVEGIVMPVAYDDNKNRIIDIELMSTGGTRQMDTDKVITRYDQRIAMAVLADFLLLGHEAVGSKALGSSKIDLWMLTVESVAKAVASVINTHAIPRLLRLNGIDTENPPQIGFGAVDSKDLAPIGTFLKDAVDAGILIPDRELEDHIREIADLPPVNDETRDDMYPEGFRYGPQPTPPQLDPANQDPNGDPSNPGAKPETKTPLPGAPKGDGLPSVPGDKPTVKKPNAANQP